MPNLIEYAQIFQEKLDMQMIQKATTGWMEANAGLVIYNGGDTIKIPKIVVEGLKDYSRANGYPDAGGIDFSYQPKTFDKDRSAVFNLDKNDVDETKFVLTAGTAMAEFQRTQSVPEIDAYRHSKIYELANEAGRVGKYTPDKATILQQLEEDISNIQDVVGEDVELVVLMSYAFSRVLSNADKLEKKIDSGDFKSGEVSTTVKMLDGIPLLRIPSDRFKTAYDFKTGAESGFAPSAGAELMNYIIIAKKAPIAISKTDDMNIFDPKTNQSANGWKMTYRKYHTMFIPDNQMASVFVSVPEADPVSTVPLTLVTANNTVTVTLGDGAFETGVSMDDFSFAGTDAVALANGSLVRTNDTEVVITIATGNTGTDNVITVLGSAMDIQATSVTAVASTV